MRVLEGISCVEIVMLHEGLVLSYIISLLYLFYTIIVFEFSPFFPKKKSGLTIVEKFGGRLNDMPSESILLLGSFALTLLLLIFGTQFLVQTFDLFPADPSSPPASLRNV